MHTRVEAMARRAEVVRNSSTLYCKSKPPALNVQRGRIGRRPCPSAQHTHSKSPLALSRLFFFLRSPDHVWPLIGRAAVEGIKSAANTHRGPANFWVWGLY